MTRRPRQKAATRHRNKRSWLTSRCRVEAVEAGEDARDVPVVSASAKKTKVDFISARTKIKANGAGGWQL